MSKNLISIHNMKDVEQYATILLTYLISLQTMEKAEKQALKIGILDDDEQELSKTIIWEIRRLYMLYNQQIESVLERCPLTREQVVEKLKILLLEK